MMFTHANSMDLHKVLTELKVFRNVSLENDVKIIMNSTEDNTLKFVFLTLYELLNIHAILPVTSDTVERSFSKLKGAK